VLNCPVCDSPTQHQRLLCPTSFNYGSEHSLQECLDCETTYFQPSPTLNQLGTFYLAESYEFSRRSQEHRARVIVKKHLRTLNQGAFLDIGCGTGYLLNEIRARTNWSVYGVELSPRACDFAKDKLNLNTVINADLAAAKYQDNFFDVLHISEVLEHVPSPVEFLHECRRIIKPEGIMLLSLPNGQSDRQGLLDFWQANSKPPGHASGHIYFFSPASLRVLFVKTGFEILSSQTYAFKQGLRSLGLFPKRRGWAAMHQPRSVLEARNKDEIRVSSEKHSQLYYQVKYGLRDLMAVPGLHRIGHAFRLVIRPI